MKWIRKFCVVFMLVGLMFSIKSEAADASLPLSRQNLQQMLVLAAQEYQPNMPELIKGYDDGDNRLDQPATRLEALIMIKRAFGELNTPKGHYQRVYETTVTFTDIPDWAKVEVEELCKAGVLEGTASGELGISEPITKQEVQQIISRIYALEGSNKKDDFYATVNKQALENSSLPIGTNVNGELDHMAYKINDQISALLEEMTQQTYEKGSKQQKLADFYRNAIHIEARNQQGITPLDPYFLQIDHAKNLEDLIQVDNVLKKELGISALLLFSLQPNAKVSGEYQMQFQTLFPLETKEIYTNERKATIFQNSMTELLELAGYDKSTADQLQKRLFAMESQLSRVGLDISDYGNMEQVYNEYTVDELEKKYPELSVKSAMEARGFFTDQTLIIPDKEIFLQANTYFKDKNLDLLQAYMKVRLLFSFQGALSEDLSNIFNEYKKQLSDIQGSKSVNQLAIEAVENYLPYYLGEQYAQKYFSPEAKADVENIVDEIVAQYKKNISQLDWLGVETKQEAVKKLETLKYKIGYPDAYPNILNGIDILPFEQGGSFFKNVTAILRVQSEAETQAQGQTSDPGIWFMAPYAVNAYYYPSNNEIVLPAGILQAPFYDPLDSKEEKLAGIGTVIAHEISHAFDNNGAKYDENGNYKNWWTTVDEQNFQKKCASAVELFDGIEVITGVYNNGKLTLSENVADLGGMACTLAIASNLEDPNLKLFFERYAKIWARTMTREEYEIRSHVDSHSATAIRVNWVLKNFELFYTTYDVKEGDGMYLSPEERVKIW